MEAHLIRVGFLGISRGLAWGSLYWILTRATKTFGVKMQKDPLQVSCRLVCVIHALAVCALATVSNIIVGPWAFHAVGEPNTPLQTFILEISLGYFVFDLYWCVFVGKEPALMLTHHVASIAVCACGLFLEASGSELVGSLFGAELSNPFLQLRWFLMDPKSLSVERSARRRSTGVLAAELAFAVVFLVCRVVLSPPLLWTVLRSTRPHWSVKAGGVILQLISWIWAAGVAGKLVRGFREILRPLPPP